MLLAQRHTYGTNHTKLNSLRPYTFSENALRMDTCMDGTGVPVLLFTLYSNQHLEIDISK